VIFYDERTADALPKPWPDFLKEIDSAISRPVDLHCIGGFVLTASYGLPRSTGDLDYVQVIPQDAAAEIEDLAGLGSVIARKYRLFLQSVGIADLPDGYASRAQELQLGLSRLRLWVLEPYDLLLSKLPRNSPKDREDATYLIQKLELDFQTFYSRWQQEMAPWIANRGRHELTIQLWKEYFQK